MLGPGYGVSIVYLDEETLELAISFERHSTMTSFAQLLSGSRSVELNFTTHVRPCDEDNGSDDSGDWELDSADNSSDDFILHCDVCNRSVREANELVAEAILRSGILVPLSRLFNVEKFNVTWNIWRYSDFEPVFRTSSSGRKYSSSTPFCAFVAHELKTAIEENWQLKQESQKGNKPENEHTNNRW